MQLLSRYLKHRFNIILIIFLAILIGCASTAIFDNLIKQNHFVKTIHEGKLFKLLTISNQQYYKDKSMLYVFIDGDGIPWRTRTQISTNPDPINPLVLTLMSETPYPGIYLSRPCYWIQNNNCHFQWWTNKRYSQTVVDNMIDALQIISKDYDAITLIGYSGGGALAVIIANSVEKITRIITLSANLDHKKWTSYHNYSPLIGSLNAIDYRLPMRVSQYHFAAENDKNIFPSWIEHFSKSQPNSQFFLIKNIDHQCCWLNQWKNIIKIINF